MLAIRVKYVGATNFKPSRLIASTGGIDGKARSVTMSYNAAEDAAQASGGNSQTAIFAEAAKMLMRKHGFKGKFQGGELPDGSMAFVFTAPFGQEYEQNPRPRMGAKNAGRVSSATGKRPSKRLIRRRRANVEKGYFPNPGRNTGVRVVYNRLLGGWYVVKGPHQTPISGKFASHQDAKQSIIDAQNRRDAPRRSNPVNHLGEREFRTYAGWKRAVKAIDPNAEFYGDSDIGGAKNIGEWEGDKGSIFTDADRKAQRGANPVRRLAKRAGIRFYRKAGDKWLMFDPATYPAKTKAEAQKIARALAQMFRTQIKVVIDK